MRNKRSIIQQLQEEALNPNISISDLLRKAKVVATKLNLKDFLEWIERELNGYEVKTQEELPAYRIISGETKAWNPFHGWQPIIFEDPETANLLSKRGIAQPISELEDIVKSKTEGPLFINFSQEAKQAIIRGIGYKTDVKFMIGRNAIAGILDAIRNVILDWSLKLDKAGIRGNGLSFSQEEREKAHQPGIIYKIGHIEKFAGIIGSISGDAKVSIHQINLESKEELLKLVEQIKKYIPQIDLGNEDRKCIEEILTELDAEMKLEKPKPSRVKSLLSSIKNILEGATSNVIAQGIIVGIEKFIG